MDKILYIKNCRNLDAGDWFIGEGFYFIDETSCLQWAGDSMDEAVEAYVSYLQAFP